MSNSARKNSQMWKRNCCNHPKIKYQKEKKCYTNQNGKNLKVEEKQFW
jgi:hypothetical protein